MDRSIHSLVIYILLSIGDGAGLHAKAAYEQGGYMSRYFVRVQIKDMGVDSSIELTSPSLDDDLSMPTPSVLKVIDKSGNENYFYGPTMSFYTFEERED